MMVRTQSNWSGRWESNPRHSAWEADVLPLNYARIDTNDLIKTRFSPQACRPQIIRFFLTIFMSVARPDTGE
jgi:hypothetical protein